MGFESNKMKGYQTGGTHLLWLGMRMGTSPDHIWKKSSDFLFSCGIRRNALCGELLYAAMRTVAGLRPVLVVV